jgi:dynein heavy chain
VDKLKALNEDWVVARTSFNHYTTHHMIQAVLEAPLEKKAGRNYGPPGTKRLVYFVDDLNMPEVDKYGTASPHTVMRQHLDYNHWYDRQKHQLKNVANTQYICSMNPKAGSFTIDPRLQRHFSVFAVSNPSNEALKTIYLSLLDGHLRHKNFPSQLIKMEEKLVDVAITVHNKVCYL